MGYHARRSRRAGRVTPRPVALLGIPPTGFVRRALGGVGESCRSPSSGPRQPSDRQALPAPGRSEVPHLTDGGLARWRARRAPARAPLDEGEWFTEPMALGALPQQGRGVVDIGRGQAPVAPAGRQTPHLLNRVPAAISCALRAPTGVGPGPSVGCVPLVPLRAFPTQRLHGVDVDLRQAAPAMRPCQRLHVNDGELTVGGHRLCLRRSSAVLSRRCGSWGRPPAPVVLDPMAPPV